MRKRCTRTLSLLSVIVFIGLSTSLAAEIPIVRGQVQPSAPELVQGLFVILDAPSTQKLTRVEVQPDGSFEFRDIASGDYVPRLTDGFGLTVCQEFVTIRDHMPKVEVQLPERESSLLEQGRRQCR